MMLATLRDTQWRRRRAVVAVVSTGLVFAVTLVLTGLANGFRVEARRTVDSLGVDTFLVKDGASGPFLGSAPFPEAELQSVVGTPGVVAAAPLDFGGATVRDGDTNRNVSTFGAPESGPGMPTVTQGRPPSSPDEIAVSSTLGRHLGDELQIGSRTLRIVGIVDNSTALADTPNVFLTTAGAQQLGYGGQPLISSIGIRGTPAQIPAGFHAVDRAGAQSDLMRPLKVAVDEITIVAIMLWIVAALIVGAVTLVNALERLRDFAVFKAIGVPTRSIAAGLALQSIATAVIAAAVGVVLQPLLAPLFTMQVVVPGWAYVMLPVVAVAIGLLAGTLGLRRAVTVDPAVAFGGS